MSSSVYCKALNTLRHIQAFAEALMADEFTGFDSNEMSPAGPNSPLSQNTRVRKVSALSDFAPVNLKVKR
jgi:hypothetical protein